MIESPDGVLLVRIRTAGNVGETQGSSKVEAHILRFDPDGNPRSIFLQATSGMCLNPIHPGCGAIEQIMLLIR